MARRRLLLLYPEVEERDAAFTLRRDQGTLNALLFQEGSSGGKTRVISVPLLFPVLMFNENVS